MRQGVCSLLWVLAAGSALAGTIERAALPCAAEPTARSRAICLAAVVETRRAALRAWTGGAAAGLGASAPRGFVAALERSQNAWRDRTDRACRAASPGDRSVFETCRLAATLTREAAVRGELAGARRRLGLPALLVIEAPDSVEVLVPLPAPPGGPDARIRVPLTVPVVPE